MKSTTPGEKTPVEADNQHEEHDEDSKPELQRSSQLNPYNGFPAQGEYDNYSY